MNYRLQLLPLLLAANEAISSAQRQPIVTIDQGRFAGNSSDPAAFAFWSIPFAQPPVGDLRFRPPRPLNTTSSDVFDASAPPRPEDACVQLGVDPRFNLPDPALGAFGNEDCLKLDIYTPSTAIDSNGTAAGGSLRPVMVWIYGGGGLFGHSYYLAANPESAKPVYDGRSLASSGDVVVVSINYRLMGLGFMGLKALQDEDPNNSTGNYALQDANLALRWVRDNIARFGGDPSRVTIFGQSAGGLMVAWQLAMRASEGLFHGAILESEASPGANDAQTVEQKQAAFTLPGRWIGSKSPVDECCDSSIDGDDLCVNINTTEFVQCLRSLPAELFVGTQYTGAPTIDNSDTGYSDTMFKIFESGTGNKVPIVLGSNRFESLGGGASDKTDLFPYGLGLVGGFESCSDAIDLDVEDDAFGRELIVQCGGAYGPMAAPILANNETWSKALALYPREDYSTAQERWMIMISHLSYEDENGLISSGNAATNPCSVQKMAASYGEFSRLPVHLYSFENMGGTDLIQHSTEFALVFGTDFEEAREMMPVLDGIDAGTYGEYSDLFETYWTNFARTGDPNNNGGEGPEWTAFSGPRKAAVSLELSRMLRGNNASTETAPWNVLMIGNDDKDSEPARMSDGGPWYQARCEFWQDIVANDSSRDPTSSTGNTGQNKLALMLSFGSIALAIL